MEVKDNLMEYFIHDQASTELNTLYVVFQGKAVSIMHDCFLYRLCRKVICKKKKAKALISRKHQNRAKLNGRWN